MIDDGEKMNGCHANSHGHLSSKEGVEGAELTSTAAQPMKNEQCSKAAHRDMRLLRAAQAIVAHTPIGRYGGT